MSKSQRINLGSQIVISQVEALCNELEDAFNKGSSVVFDAGEVQRVDAAALQLLAAFFISYEKAGLTAKWESVSEDLKGAVKLLGLSASMELE